MSVAVGVASRCRAVGVVGDGRQIGAAGVLARNRPSLSIIAPARIGVAVLVDDPGQGVRELRVAVGVFAGAPVRVGDRDEIVVRVVGISIDPAVRYRHLRDPTGAVIAKSQRVAEWAGHGCQVAVGLVSKPRGQASAGGDRRELAVERVGLGRVVGVQYLPADLLFARIKHLRQSGRHIGTGLPHAGHQRERIGVAVGARDDDAGRGRAERTLPGAAPSGPKTRICCDLAVVIARQLQAGDRGGDEVSLQLKLVAGCRIDRVTARGVWRRLEIRNVGCRTRQRRVRRRPGPLSRAGRIRACGWARRRRTAKVVRRARSCRGAGV